MNADEKVEYVRKSIEDMVKTSPSGIIKMVLYSVGHPNNEDWTLLTIGEQKRILKKFEEDGKIKNLDLYNDKRIVSFEVVNTGNDINKKAQIIKNFNSLNLDDFETNERIYLLKVLYSYYEEIVRSYYGSGLFFLTSGIDELNDYFKILRKKIIGVIKSDKTFSEIEESKAYQTIIESITGLYTSTDFFDGVWEDFTLPLIVDLRESISNKDLFENGSEIHKFNLSITEFLNTVSEEVNLMKNFLAEKTKNFYENELPKTKKSFNESSDFNERETIKHEHTHKFENSIQEKDIVLNHKYENNNSNELYIIKKNNDFYYNGKYLNLSKNAEYFKVFSALFARLPNGGEITYKELSDEIKSRMPKTKSKNKEEMRKFIQGNLTDTSNGFIRYAKIPISEDSGKPLIEIMRGSGVRFNNTRG